MTDTTEAAPASEGATGLSAMKLPQLQALASELGVSGTTKMKKSELMEAIQNGGVVPAKAEPNDAPAAKSEAPADTGRGPGRDERGSGRQGRGPGEQGSRRAREAGGRTGRWLGRRQLRRR